ncbi:ciliogenesis-associated TTC17-interacting protein isoform X1 [Silurus asotus]|uniref:Ciliogenesis-associated TTC17-interacting protein n=1 Tax=Silurus asotus TaxID=30991 RepID=A0AAD5AC60_SILAS|nr:ciliogenesis-associated TTC17-interacting protein isoform X1 [Silurus asotus]
MQEKTEKGPKASKEALEFLSSIRPEDIDRCLFMDSMVTVSETGKDIGEFYVTVKNAVYNDEPCYLVHANSHGAIDNIPCGTSIMSYVSKSLETLEESHEEYMKLQEHTLDKKTHIVRQGNHLVVNRVISQKDEVKNQVFTFPLHTLQGFVSETSNLLIMRILAQQKKVPENLTFLSFDADTQVGMSTYRELEVTKQEVDKEMVEVFGIERTVSSAEPLQTPATWHCYFLPDGHLAKRVQVGSSVTMNLLHLPPVTSEDERAHKSVFVKKPLVWEEDIELYSKFIDKKEEMKADYSSYIRQHPEIKALLADFLQMVLLRKPQDVFSFASDFFSAFDSRRPPLSSFEASPDTTTAKDDKS